MNNTLEIINISKAYKSRTAFKGSTAVHALSNISLTFSPGFYGVLGPNGAGKSTLMNIIVGNLRQDEGLVLWNGQDIRRMGKKYRKILAYVPQQQTLYDNYTGRRFLYYVAALKGVPKTEVESRTEKAASVVNLSNELEKRLSAYSGGMKQRLLVAAALLDDPQLIIMDEPMAGLDPKERVQLREFLKDIAKNSMVIVSSHVVSDIERPSDKMLILKKGHLIDFAPPKELIAEYHSTDGMEGVYMTLFENEEET